MHFSANVFDLPVPLMSVQQAESHLEFLEALPAAVEVVEESWPLAVSS